MIELREQEQHNSGETSADATGSTAAACWHTAVTISLHTQRGREMGGGGLVYGVTFWAFSAASAPAAPSDVTDCIEPAMPWQIPEQISQIHHINKLGAYNINGSGRNY